MEVSIVLSKICCFAKTAEDSVRMCLEGMINQDDSNLNLKVKSFDLKELCHSSVAVSVRKSRFQIVVISHTFLENIKNCIENCQVYLSRALNTNRVICVLVGIDSDEIIKNYSGELPNFSKWSILSHKKKVTPEFLRQFTEAAIRSFDMSQIETDLKNHRALTKISPRTEIYLPIPSASYEPKVKLEIEKSYNESSRVVKIKLVEPSTEKYDTILIEMKKGAHFYSTEVNIKDLLSLNSNDEENKRDVAPSRLRKVSYDPMEAIMQKVPECRGYLDEIIAGNVSYIVKQNGSIDQMRVLNCLRAERSDMFPTIMHFASYHGLKETVLNLIESKEGAESCFICNELNQTPLEIALIRKDEVADNDEIEKDYEDIINTLKIFQDLKNNEEQMKAINDEEINIRDLDATANKVENNMEKLNLESSSEEFLDQKDVSSLSSESEDYSSRLNLEYKFSMSAEDENGPPPPLPHKKLKEFHYDVPPILYKKNGTIPRGATNYILLEGVGENINMTPLTLTDVLKDKGKGEEFDLSSDEEMGEIESKIEERYEKPCPKLSFKKERAKREVVLPASEQELVDKMYEFLDKIRELNEVDDRNEVDSYLTSWREKSDVRKEIEEKEKEIQEMRTEYFVKLKTSKRKESSGAITRFFGKILIKGKKSQSQQSGSSRRISVEEKIPVNPISPPVLKSPSTNNSNFKWSSITKYDGSKSFLPFTSPKTRSSNTLLENEEEKILTNQENETVSKKESLSRSNSNYIDKNEIGADQNIKPNCIIDMKSKIDSFLNALEQNKDLTQNKDKIISPTLKNRENGYVNDLIADEVSSLPPAVPPKKIKAYDEPFLPVPITSGMRISIQTDDRKQNSVLDTVAKNVGTPPKPMRRKQPICDKKAEYVNMNESSSNATQEFKSSKLCHIIYSFKNVIPGDQELSPQLPMETN